MEVLFFLGAIAAIVFWFFVGTEFARIAAMKGHTERRYFWWTFLVAPVGMAMVIALPHDAVKAEKAAETADELPEI